MSEEAAGLAVLVGFSTAVAFAVHWRWRRFWAASLAAAGLSIGWFEAAVSLRLGYLDPFLPVALLTGGTLAFGIAAAVGALVRRLRRRP
jgi:hypothetical protein